MIAQFFGLLGLLAIAATKFLYAPAAIYMSGYTFLQAMLICLGGGFAGVFFFFKTGNTIRSWWMNRFSSGKKERVFTKTSRLISRIRVGYGLYGLAFVTPCIISIPIGCLLAARYYGTDRRTLPFLLVAVVFWAFVLCGITFAIGPIFG